MPHAGNTRIEEEHGGHDESASAPPTQQSLRSAAAFTAGGPESGISPEDLDFAHQEFWELRRTPDVAPITHDEIASPFCAAANVVGMLCICLVPYCVNGVVTWKGLPHAATFPVFCLGVVVALYASVMFVVLRYMPGNDDSARESARQSVWLLYATAMLLCLLAVVTNGSWSIDAIVVVSP